MTRYLVSFGNEGLETVVNLDELKAQDDDFLAAKLADLENKNKQSLPSGQVMQMLQLRYRINMHRCIKSYILEYDGQKNDIWDHEKFIIKLLKKEGKEIRI